MTAKTLKDHTPEALNKNLREARARLRELRSEIASHQLRNVREVRKVKKQIAQINTFLNAKEIAKAE